jgi:protein-tyrosine phosphatase
MDRWPNPMAHGREIAWEGFYNARDLGGLPTRDGRSTRRGALIRSADPRFVTNAGWQAAYDAGVRTIVDLRNDDEVRPSAGPGPTALGGSARLPPSTTGPVVPTGMRRMEVPLDGVEDIGFWRYLNDERLNGTPLYYRPFLERKPDRCAAAVAAIAHAPAGGVIFHCAGGRDRTGLLTLLVLSVVGVDPEIIAADYGLTAQSLRSFYAVMGREDEGHVLAQVLASKGTTARQAILATLDGLDVEAYLLDAGLSRDDLAAVRTRLLS